MANFLSIAGAGLVFAYVGSSPQGRAQIAVEVDGASDGSSLLDLASTITSDRLEDFLRFAFQAADCQLKGALLIAQQTEFPDRLGLRLEAKRNSDSRVVLLS